MKYKILFCFVLTGFLMQSCTEESIQTTNHVRLTFSLQSSSGEPVSVPDNHLLLAGITTSTGETNEFELAFHSSGSLFATTPLDVEPGEYWLTDLMLVDENRNPVYVLPLDKSPLGRGTGTMRRLLVDGAEAEVPTYTLMEVASRAPREFGYKNFKKGQKQSLKIAAYTLVQGKETMTSAMAFLMIGADTVEQFTLSPKMNHLPLSLNSGQTYRLLVARDGYALYTQTLQAGSISPKPLKVVLKPAYTMVAIADATGYLAFELDGFPGTVVIDWGDGSQNTEHLADITNVDMVQEHTYSEPGRYFISVTGDLDKIHTLLFGGVAVLPTERMNLDQLTGLLEIRFMFTPTPDVIDVSMLNNLGSIIFWNTDVHDVRISPVKPPSNIELENSHLITTESFDRIIDVIYNYSLLTGRMGGFMTWATWDRATSQYIPHGPPSPETFDKMRILVAQYGWEFGPGIDEIY